jgi:hypothetical protein
MSDSEDDFFALLGKSISNPVQKNENICLISLEPLEKDCVKLECGHCFNYMSLFQEYKIQAVHIYKNMYKNNGVCFSCPYCRTKQTDVLYLKDNVKYYTPVHKPLRNVKCQWVYKMGKKKGEQCSSISKAIYDGKYYCNIHCKNAMKPVKKNIVKKKEDENVVIKDENVVVDYVALEGKNIVVLDTIIEKNVDKMLDELMTIFKKDNLYILQELCNVMKVTYNNKDKQYVKPAIVGLMANLKLFFGKNISYMDTSSETLETVDIKDLDDLKMRLKLEEGESVKMVGESMSHTTTENSIVIPLRNLSKLFGIKQVGTTLELEVKMADYITMMNSN